MRPDGEFITGADFPVDGAVEAGFWYVKLSEVRS